MCTFSAAWKSVAPLCGFYTLNCGFPDAFSDQAWIQIFCESCGICLLISDTLVDAQYTWIIKWKKR